MQVWLFNSACVQGGSDPCYSPWSTPVALPRMPKACSIPSEKVKPIFNEDEALIDARCYAACIDKVSQALL